MTKEQKLNKEEYIILPGKSRADRDYVSIHRLGLDERVEKAVNSLNIRVQNTAKELLGSQYIGNISWKTALKLNLKLGSSTLPLKRFFDLKELLESGLQGKEVYNGKEKLLPKNKIMQIYDEIFGLTEPWRGEHLDACFLEEHGRLYLLSNHVLKKNSKLHAKLEEPLQNCIMEDREISMTKINEQGLPSVFEKFYYFYPRADSVAGFYAGSVRAGLFCGRNPTSTNSSLGVREVRRKL